MTQVLTGSVRYDISYDPSRRRWYLDASWALPRTSIPGLAELATSRIVAVDLNAGHLACWVVDPAGNPVGQPHTIPLALDGLGTATRDGRLRAAISQLIAFARAHECRVLAIEHLDFGDVRAIGRERLGRGRRGKRVRRRVSGIPTGRFRDRLVQMCANQGLWVLAVNPAYTSRWGRQYWLSPLQQRTSTATVHHAAAVVIGRRALGHRARRRPHVPTGDRRIAAVESCGSGRSLNRGRAGTRLSETRLRSDLASHQTDGGDRSRSGTRPFSTVRDGPAPPRRR
jgi:transposase